MRKCWAKSHSACSQGLSREHIISAGIFDQPTIFVQGFDWCQEEKEIGLSGLTSKILCRRHNSILESADRAGIAAIRVFDETINPSQGTADTINGLELERWLLKVAINLSFRGSEKLGVGMLGTEAGYPAPYLLEVVFGNRIFDYQMGVYVLFPAGEYRFRRGEIVVTPIRRNNEIGGVYFSLRGIHVFLSLLPGHAPPPLGKLGNITLPKHVLEANPCYRPSSIIIPKLDGIKSTIKFGWRH